MITLTAVTRWLRRGRSPAPAVRAHATGELAAAPGYDAASQTRRARTWRAPTIGANDSVLPSLALLRARARALVRNDGYARAAIDRLVSNIVGGGLVPQSQAPDDAFRDAVQRAWLRWTDEADAAGRLDLYGLQAQAVRSWLEAGEVFVRIRSRRPEDGLSVPMQLELLEPEYVPVEYSITTRDGNRVRAGIEFDALGRRVAYWVHRHRPGALQDLDTAQLVRLPAGDGLVRERVLHLYEPLRPGQLRGVPVLTQALLRLRDLDLFSDATLLRQQLANMFVGFLVPGHGAVDAGTDFRGQPIERDAEGRGVVGLEPGLFHELAPGADVKFAEPPAPQGFADFARAQLMAAAVAADVPYELLTGDLRDVSDRAVRVVLQEFRRRVEQRQHHLVVYQFCRPVWAAWFAHALMAGAIPVPPRAADDPAWSAVEWIAPAWPALHPVQDVEAERAMVRAGFKSRTQVAKERGYDVEALDREIAADNARADRLGLTLDSDPRKTSVGGAPAEPPTPEGGRG
jgi:lambda family phage portal protein